MELLPFLLDESPSGTNPRATPHWWKRRECFPAPFPARLASYLKLDDKRDARADIAPGALIDERSGPVLIGAGTRICHGAVIQGPVVIGADCLIGNYAFIRGGSAIGNNVKIGFATEIKSAVIESEATIGPQCFIADSVIDKKAYLGAQVRTSNHRLDGQNVCVRIGDDIVDSGRDKLGCYIGCRARLGVQTIVLPGRIIAADTTIGPRVNVERNLPAGHYVLRQELIRTGDNG